MSNDFPFVLWLLVAPNFIRSRCGGSLTACKSNLKNIGTATEMYSTDYAGHYPRNLNMLTPNYLKTIPECPAGRRVTYRADFGPKAPGNSSAFEDYYLVECTGTSHQGVSVPPDYPKYNAIEGLVERPPQG
jgi:hypothetical protein